MEALYGLLRVEGILCFIELKEKLEFVTQKFYH